MDIQGHFPTDLNLSVVFSNGLSLPQLILLEMSNGLSFTGTLQWNFTFVSSGVFLHVASKLFTLLDLCVSSLRRGHANILCIVPIVTDDPRRESIALFVV